MFLTDASTVRIMYLSCLTTRPQAISASWRPRVEIRDRGPYILIGWKEKQEFNMAATLDWSQCPAVESIPGKVSGAWVFKDTRLPVATVIENLEDFERRRSDGTVRCNAGTNYGCT
jgi:hypothetical protein